MPLRPQRQHAILRSAIHLLQTTGYDAMTLDAVAAHAHASKATIYRRWNNKAQLTKAALDALDKDDNAAIPDTGTLRGDLLATMHMLQKKVTAPYLAMIQSLMLATRHDKTLDKALKEHISNEELSPFEEVLKRAVKRGDLPKNAPIELVHDIAEAMIQRQLQSGSPFNAAFIRKVVDRVLLPLLTR